MVRYHSLLPASDATSDRIAYAMFLATVTARPMMPLPRSSPAAHSWVRMAATPRPDRVSANETSCHQIECGMNANG